MKKFLLICLLTISAFSTNAQFAFNEVYARPSNGGGQTEYLELYNVANQGTNTNINLDCYTILSYFDNNTGRGWYVLNLPPDIMTPGAFYKLSSGANVIWQGGSTSTDLNWNNPKTGSALTKYTLSGSTYTPSLAPANLNDFVEEQNGGGYNFKSLILIFKNSQLVQGFLGGSSSSALGTQITGMPNLSINSSTFLPGACNTETFQFSDLNSDPAKNARLSFAGAATGTSNGYYRTYDGNCAPWEKSSSGTEHTPGTTNGSNPVANSFITGYRRVTCLNYQFYNFEYGITATSGAATAAATFPVFMEVFGDVDGDQIYDPGVDVPVYSETITQGQVGNILTSQTAIPFNLSTATGIIVLYSTANSCYDAVYFFPTPTCINLPVVLTSFTAERKNQNALLSWETSTEINSRGFIVERNNGNNVWQEVGFVASQAVNGSSTSSLKYQFSDPNNSKQITQYRIRQVDLNEKSVLSEIRSVRGLEQKGGIILYPNPSNDGRVNIVFEDRNVVRDVAVTDMSGRTVKQLKGIASNSVTIDNLVSGMYTIRVSVPATGEQTIEKIIVNKH